MAAVQLSTLLRHLRRVVGPGACAGLTDAQLLERFVTEHDAAAFEVLVWRHGSMVLGVCRRVLRREQDTEDAFQATFLVLLRKAGSIGKRESVGSWLHQVAYRVALAARVDAARRAARETAGVEELADRPAPELPGWELRRVLDEEVSRLPEKYRTPFVLCHLEGKTNQEAATELGCPVGTLAARLSRARRRLRIRLTRRGMALSAGTLTAALAEGRATAVSSPLVRATVQSAGLGAAAPVARGVAGRVAALTAQVACTLGWARWQAAACLLLLLAVAGTGFGVLADRQPGQKPAPAAAAAPRRVQQQPEDPLAERVRWAVTRGTAYLKRTQKEGSWENIDPTSAGHRGGWTSLALLALLNSGVKPEDPIIEDGLRYLRQVEPRQTYVVSLQTMVFVAAGKPADRVRIQRNVNWLLDARVRDGAAFKGWTYGAGRSPQSDNSNTQFAVMALDAASRAGAKVDKQVWEEIRNCYLTTQHVDGGWPYNPATPGGSTLTMTCAGICGLLLADRHLAEKPAGFDQALARALDYLGEHFTLKPPYNLYYLFHGIARTGQLSGKRTFGKRENHDWYRAGCEILVREQRNDGSWVESRGRDGWPVISTSFALLFLAKGK